MNPVNAAVVAGYSINYANAKSYRIERLVKVGMAEVFERAGLTDKAIVAHALEGLNAMKVVNADVYTVDGEVDKDQSANREVKDWNARHKYFNTILQLTDKLKEAGIKIENHTHLTKIDKIKVEGRKLDDVVADFNAYFISQHSRES